MLNGQRFTTRFILSPLLFNVFIGDLLRILRFKSKRANIGENKINSLIYTVDIVSIQNSRY